MAHSADCGDSSDQQFSYAKTTQEVISGRRNPRLCCCCASRIPDLPTSSLTFTLALQFPTSSTHYLYITVVKCISKRRFQRMKPMAASISLLITLVGQSPSQEPAAPEFPPLPWITRSHEVGSGWSPTNEFVWGGSLVGRSPA